MRIGYAVINNTLGLGIKNYRLASYTPEKFLETARINLERLNRILRWNVEHGILFYRISSDLIPFASHPICKLDWKQELKKEFSEVGDYVKANNIRLADHASHFTVLSSQNPKTHNDSLLMLEYMAQMFDLMGLDKSHKLQVHLGGAFGSKVESIRRTIKAIDALPNEVRKRLAIEHEERVFGIEDCFEVHLETGVPVVFDTLHHEVAEAKRDFWFDFDAALATWSYEGTKPMIDYSNQESGKRPGAHSDSVDAIKFAAFMRDLQPRDVDIMLEVKDKDISALRVCDILSESK